MDRLTRWERLGLALVAALLVLFGGLVELRGAFQHTRKTDLTVYLRAAEAVRAGEDVYAVTDEHGWHYCYPPPFAVLLVPFTDLPFPLAVALWYAFSLGCAAFAVDRFAAAVLPGEPRYSRRWWYARTVPFYVCVGGIGYTLSRGQVNLQVVALWAAGFAALASGKRFTAGAWLGAAVCLKAIPAYLVLFPLLRRDGRMFGGLTAGVVVGLGLIPAAVWGPGEAVGVNVRMVEAVLFPGVSGGGDRAIELTNDTATDSQSFQAVFHTWLNPVPEVRPPAADRETRLAHWSLSVGLTLLTAAVALRRRPTGAADQLVLFGSLAALMVLVTPVSHTHYYACVLPLACGVWLKGLAARPGCVTAGPWPTAVLAGWGLATAVVLLPGAWATDLREGGFGTAATVGLWAYGLAGLGRPTSPRPVFRLPDPRQHVRPLRPRLPLPD